LQNNWFFAIHHAPIVQQAGETDFAEISAEGATSRKLSGKWTVCYVAIWRVAVRLPAEGEMMQP